MSLALPTADRRAWIRSRLEPLTTSPPDAAQFATWQATAYWRNLIEPAAPPTLAAVLVALVERPSGLTVLLTKRPDTLRRHAGQIAFPGGRAEPGETPTQTALREAAEEVGLPAAAADLAGEAEPCLTGTGFLIVPVVAFIPPDLPLRPDPVEVEDIFETPLEFIMDPANHQEHLIRTGRGDEEVTTWAVTWHDRLIWGATAAILRLLHARLLGPAPREAAVP